MRGGCPSCGKNSDKIIVEENRKKRFISNAKWALVPDEYIGKSWSKSDLFDNHPELEKDMLFNNYCNRLEKFHKQFLDGIIPAKSVFISARSQMSKWILAYSCMQLALTKAVSVAPFLDTIELKRLLILGGENPNYKLYGRINYDDYMTSTVCFVSVTKSEKFCEAYTTLIDLIARRSRLGLATYIISKFTLKEISQSCVDSDYTKLIDRTGSQSDLKYPVIIEYK
ncbi:hypothetical protein D3C81_899570 [compost metagenome]